VLVFLQGFFNFVVFVCRNLYVHGFVVDDDGRKMSKSIGNVVNPSDVVEGNKAKKAPAFGADVLRYYAHSRKSFC